MRVIAAFSALALCLAGIMVFTGCETESAADSIITVTPSYAHLRPNESANFTASGGYEYNWALSDNTIGFLSNTRGATVRYTARIAPVSNATAVSIQTLTVTSTIPGGNVGTNNTPTYQRTGTARIEHLPALAAPGTVPEVYISPTSVTLNPGGAQIFAASGGTGSYSWSLSQPTWGSLTSSSGNNTAYTATYDPGSTNDYASQVLTVTSGGRTASAVVTHWGI